MDDSYRGKADISPFSLHLSPWCSANQLGPKTHSLPPSLDQSNSYGFTATSLKGKPTDNRIEFHNVHNLADIYYQLTIIFTVIRREKKRDYRVKSKDGNSCVSLALLLAYRGRKKIRTNSIIKSSSTVKYKNIYNF
jgi:hypothetical protein